jgi:antitoxin (DNA-binding transcriptional repressor) of toxin-antitoxin stability system
MRTSLSGPLTKGGVHDRDAAHAGETIVVAKGGKPWARLVPLEPPSPRRVPGVLAGRLKLPPLEVLLEPLPAEELAAMEQPLL